MTGDSFKLGETAVDEFNRRGDRNDGARVVTSLNAGLSVLRDLMYERMHRDVESAVGIDSMLMPVSEMKTQQEAKTAIDVFQIAESACATRQAGYLQSDSNWYADWLAETRLGNRYKQLDSGKQITAYLAMDANGRRLAMSDIISDVLPESRQAPLVLFRLVPLAVQIVTALAFGDRQRADDLRGQQKALLPAISDCRECHGSVLENGQICQTCGNPMWTFKWLTIAD
jgi:hypothetical protein